MTNQESDGGTVRSLGVDSRTEAGRLQAFCGYVHRGGRWFESILAHRIYYHDTVSEHPGEAKYLERWVLDFKLFSIRLHRWFGNDDLRYPHNHPWWFVSVVLSGVVREQVDSVWLQRGPGKIRFFPANHTHCVSAEAWTLLLCGPARKWGFLVDGVVIPKKQYFKHYGHH